jgi:predicted RNA-binding Zn ribbon-like protein
MMVIGMSTATGAASSRPAFDFGGGALCIDFANTVGDRTSGEGERLFAYADLLDWARAAEVLDAHELAQLAAEVARQPAAAEDAFREALAFRDALFVLFTAEPDTARSGDPALARLNAVLGRALARRVVVHGRAGWRWGWAADRPSLDQPLWPVALSAVELLVSDECVRVRECGGESCTWLFVDRSRTHRRRWCDMRTCGNRAKARRHYRRQRGRQD